MLSLVIVVSMLLTGCSNNIEQDANGYSSDYKNEEYEGDDYKNEEYEGDDNEYEEDESDDFEFNDYSADFVNDFVIIKEKVYDFVGSPRKYARAMVFDTKFNKLADDYFKVVDGEEYKKYDLGITNANERGEIFAITEEDDNLIITMITKDKTVKFHPSSRAFISSSVKNLERIEYQNGYYVIDFRLYSNYPGYMGVFSKYGECIYEPSIVLDYSVYSVNVISENEFEIEFKGMDNKLYTVRTDSNGNFLSEPQLS